MATASLTAVIRELNRRMGSSINLTFGVQNCRRKVGTGQANPGWSEHSWGNAKDFMVYGYARQKPYHDMLMRMKSEGYPVGWVGWAGNDPADHTDHLHIEGSPNHSGQTPPCAGGESMPQAPQAPGTTAQDIAPRILGDAPTIDIPLVGDIGPLLYRAMWITLAMAATVVAVRLIAAGYATSAASGIVEVAKGS